jgi:hypothetical protein
MIARPALRSLSWLCVCTLALSWPVAHARADGGGKVLDEAAARYDRGVKLFDSGDYPGALAEFDAVYRLTKRWEVLFNVAVTQKKLFRYGAAVRSLERYLAEGGAGVDGPRRAAVERELTEIRALVAEITVVVEGAPAQLDVDGLSEGATPLDRPLLLGSGRHVLRATREGELPDEKAIDVVSGQNATVRLAPRPRPVEAKTATITVDSNPPGATLTVDGKAVGKAPWSGELDAGGHLVTGALDGYTKARQELVVVAGQTRRVTVELLVAPPVAEADRPVYKKWWFWTGIGAVVAGGVATAIILGNQPTSYDINVNYP